MFISGEAYFPSSLLHRTSRRLVVRRIRYDRKVTTKEEQVPGAPTKASFRGNGLYFPTAVFRILFQRSQPESQRKMDGFLQLQLSFTEKPKLGDDPVRRDRAPASGKGGSSGRDRAQPARNGSSNGPGLRTYNRAHSRRKAALYRLSRPRARREYIPFREAGKKDRRPHPFQA